MSEYKNKYLKVQRKSDKVVIRRDDVSRLNKKGRESAWDALNAEYPSSDYITCYETSQNPLHVFSDKKPNGDA